MELQMLARNRSPQRRRVRHLGGALLCAFACLTAGCAASNRPAVQYQPPTVAAAAAPVAYAADPAAPRQVIAAPAPAQAVVVAAPAPAPANEPSAPPPATAPQQPPAPELSAFTPTDSPLLTATPRGPQGSPPAGLDPLLAPAPRVVTYRVFPTAYRPYYGGYYATCGGYGCGTGYYGVGYPLWWGGGFASGSYYRHRSYGQGYNHSGYGHHGHGGHGGYGRHRR